jgi:hypothetical protein
MIGSMKVFYFWTLGLVLSPHIGEIHLVLLASGKVRRATYDKCWIGMEWTVGSGPWLVEQAPGIARTLVVLIRLLLDRRSEREA